MRENMDIGKLLLKRIELYEQTLKALQLLCEQPLPRLSNHRLDHLLLCEKERREALIACRDEFTLLAHVRQKRQAQIRISALLSINQQLQRQLRDIRRYIRKEELSPRNHHQGEARKSPPRMIDISI